MKGFDRFRRLLLSRRDRLLSDPRFTAFAFRFPPTRPIGRRRTLEIFDLVAGFVYSQVLFALIELDLLGKLGDGPLSVAELAADSGLTQSRLRLLADAAASLGLLRTEPNGDVGLGRHGAAVLADPGIAAMVLHHRHFYADLADPVALLRGDAGGRTALASYWAYAGTKPGDEPVSSENAGPYSDLMARSQAMIAREIIAAYDFSGHRRLLDIGGGHGAFVKALAAKNEALRFTLFDLPAVVAEAPENMPPAALRRTDFVGGDFTADRLPDGADIATLVRILHDHDDEAVSALLRKVHDSLPPGGVLLVAEPMAGTRRAERITAAYFAFYLMAMGQGRPRTQKEISAMLSAAGFTEIRRLKTPIPALVSIIVATTTNKLYS